jgi:Aldo/keto reductases, related to diketogulonate reductase
VHARSEHLWIPVVPIPGTKRVKWLEQNVAAADIELTDDEVATLDGLAAQAVGGRY